VFVFCSSKVQGNCTRNFLLWFFCLVVCLPVFNWILHSKIPRGICCTLFLYPSLPLLFIRRGLPFLKTQFVQFELKFANVSQIIVQSSCKQLIAGNCFSIAFKTLSKLQMDSSFVPSLHARTRAADSPVVSIPVVPTNHNDMDVDYNDNLLTRFENIRVGLGLSCPFFIGEFWVCINCKKCRMRVIQESQRQQQRRINKDICFTELKSYLSQTKIINKSASIKYCTTSTCPCLAARWIGRSS
jgi:hypothetical protein